MVMNLRKGRGGGGSGYKATLYILTVLYDGRRLTTKMGKLCCDDKVSGTEWKHEDELIITVLTRIYEQRREE